jgi:signal transduction histidine kinase/ligand-binding sensor domain-containing protein
MNWLVDLRWLGRAILCATALSSNPEWAAQPALNPGAPQTHAPFGASTRIPQPHVAATVVQLPVVDGDNHLIFKRISTAEGLSQTRVAQIVQDDLGFMWFGTQYGLNRYDGYEFKLYVHEAGRKNSLAGAFIYSLFKDHAGMLWIGCNRILDRFDPRTETFTHYHIETGDLENLGGTVVHISQDRSGMLWLATGTGLHRLDPTTGQITHYRQSLENPGGLSTNNIKWTGEDRSGILWVGTADGLDQFDPATGAVRLHIPIPDAVQISFFEDRFGQFWIVHASGTGLALFDRISNTVTRYSFYEREPSPDALTGVMGIVEDQHGVLWVGSPGIGLLQFDREHRRFIHFRNRPQDPHSIGEDKVIALSLDREGNVWTGLHSVGPNHFAPSPQQFEIFKHETDDPNSLSVNFVNALFEDRQGSLWIGNDDGLNQINRRTGERVFTTVGIGTKPMIISIAQDPSGIIWVGTYGHGLHSYNPITRLTESYRHDPADPTSLSNDVVYRVFVDHAGGLWATTGDGLDRFDREGQNFRVYRLDASSQTSQSYFSIAEDNTGKLWIGGVQSGLHRFDPATGHFTVYKATSNNPDSLRDDTVPTVYASSSHIVWIGTQNGLNRLDPTTGKIDAYDTRSGLPANKIDCILEDSHGFLWLSTTNGLSKFNPVIGTFANYTAVDGLPGNDLTGWAACFKSPRGEMFFGGFPGAVAFFPERLTDHPGSPAVVLTDFKLAGVSVPIDPDSSLTQSISYTDRITLSHAQNMFSLTFAGLDYFSPQTTRYRYRLEGLEPQWNEVGSDQRHATYTTLPAGRYTLRVQAASSRGVWNEAGARLAIEILPPWWEMWWFRTAVGLLIMLTVWLFYRLRIRQVSRQLTIRMDERLDERTRIAQELHDTVLQGLLSAKLQLEVADRQIAGDATAKPLIQRILQLLLQLIDEGRYTVGGLRLRHSEAENLERALTQIAKDLAAPETLKYHLVVEGTSRSLRPLVRDEVYRIGVEALGNAFRHSHASTVETVMQYARDHFRLLVRDNGQGIAPEVLDAGREGHFGLSGMRERARKIGARLKIRTAAGAGTEIDLIVPSSAAFERPDPHGPVYWIARLYSRVSRP